MSGLRIQQSGVAPLPQQSGVAPFAPLQARQQFLGGQIDEFEGIGTRQHLVWHALAHIDAGQARNRLAQALDVLDIERGEDVDAGIEQVLDILPALGMAAVLRIAVRQFIEDQQARPAAQGRRKIEHADQTGIAQPLKPIEQGGGVTAAMGQGYADQDLHALTAQRLGTF